MLERRMVLAFDRVTEVTNDQASIHATYLVFHSFATRNSKSNKLCPGSYNTSPDRLKVQITRAFAPSRPFSTDHTTPCSVISQVGLTPKRPAWWPRLWWPKQLAKILLAFSISKFESLPPKPMSILRTNQQSRHYAGIEFGANQSCANFFPAKPSSPLSKLSGPPTNNWLTDQLDFSPTCANSSFFLFSSRRSPLRHHFLDTPHPSSIAFFLLCQGKEDDNGRHYIFFLPSWKSDLTK